MNYKLILLYLAFFWIYYAQAQVIPRNGQPQNRYNPTQDVIYLKDSSIIKGQIIETTPERVKIQLLGGSVLVYNMNQIVVIKKENLANANNIFNPAFISKNYHKRDTGFYHHVQTKLNMGLRGYGLSAGLGISYTCGYFMNKYIGLGLTAGLERIAGYRFVPVLLDFRGYLSDKKTRFYYHMGLGYGFARTGYQIYTLGYTTRVISGTGGFYINPALGVEFASPSRHHFTLDLGYSINQGNFTVREVGWFGSGNAPEPYTEKNIFYRWVLRMGWTF